MELNGGEDKVKFLKIKKTKVALIFASVCLIVAIGYTSAYYNSTVNVENKMATQEPEIELIEKFNQDSQFLPGETVDKKVKFANSGEIDALIRVSYSQSWINQNGDFVNGDVDSVEKKWTSAWQDEWVDGNDGYFPLISFPFTVKIKVGFPCAQVISLALIFFTMVRSA